MKNKKSTQRILFTLILILVMFVYTSALAAGEILDPNFGINGLVTTTFTGLNDASNHILLQSDGKMLVSGLYQTSVPFIARYNNTGSLDATFGASGILLPKISGFTGTHVTIQSNGKLLVAGSRNGGLTVVRYNSAGTALDTTFGTGGIATISDSAGNSRYTFSDLVLQPDQKIVVVGTESNQGNFTNIIVVRFNTNGTPDSTFVANGRIILDKSYFPNNRYNNGKAVAIQSDGKIVVSGHMMDDDGNTQISLARLNVDGSMDTTDFGTNEHGTVMTPLPNFENRDGALAITDDRILVAGTVFNDGNGDLALARFNSDGSLDDSFGDGGIIVSDFGNNENLSDLYVSPEGQMIVIGKTSASSPDILIARYNSDGTLDESFGDGGKIIKDLGNTTDSGNGLAIQPNGLLLLTGSRNGTAILARYIFDVDNHPTTTVAYKSTSTLDGLILESGETTGIGGALDSTATTFNVGDDAKDKQYRGFLSFNTALLPDTAVVTSAKLEIKRQGLVGTDPFTTHGNLLLDIKSGTFSNNLALQLTDFNAAGTPGAVQEHIDPTPSPWYSLQLNNANLNSINRVGLTQFRLLFSMDDNDDMGADYLKFFSGNSTVENVPSLSITYFLP